MPSAATSSTDNHSQLPASAEAKLQRLRRAATKARAIIDGLQIEIERVGENRASAMRDLGIHDRRVPPQETTEETPTGPKRVLMRDEQGKAFLATVDSLTAELVRLQEDQRAVIVPNIAAIDEFLARHSGVRFKPALVPVPKIGKNETTAAALERNLADQRRIADELAFLQNAPRTVAEAKAAMRNEVEVLAARGRPEVDGLFRGEAITWPTEQFVAGGYGAHQYSVLATVKDTLSLVAWAHKDALIAALDRQIEAQGGGDGEALTSEDKAARLAASESKLRLLQRQAEALIEQLEGDGIPVTRTCWDPEIVLGIERA